MTSARKPSLRLPRVAFGLSAFGLSALALSACGGSDDAGPSSSVADGGATLTIASNDNFTFDPPNATVTAGAVTIAHENRGSSTHTFVIEGLVRLVDDDDKSVTLDAGDYTFYCDVPGHREAGMEGTLTVTP